MKLSISTHLYCMLCSTCDTRQAENNPFATTEKIFNASRDEPDDIGRDGPEVLGSRECCRACEAGLIECVGEY